MSVINRHNFLSLIENINHQVSKSSFVCLDFEYSGIENNNNNNIETRYLSLLETCNKYSICSIGISIATLENTTTSHTSTTTNINTSITENTSSSTENTTSSNKNTITSGKDEYRIDNYNFIMLCLKDFSISPSSISFLIQHNFDFNYQYKNGIPYCPGTDSDHLFSNLMRQLFTLIMQKPVVLHNGLLDLMFLYQHFYATLPNKFPVFLADIDDMVFNVLI